MQGQRIRPHSLQTYRGISVLSLVLVLNFLGTRELCNLKFCKYPQMENLIGVCVECFRPMLHHLVHPTTLLLLVVIIAYVVMCPYTKVEESFNMQAMHDLLFLRNDIASYDHLEFSGVVPRTFIGSYIVALVSAPIVLLAQGIMHVPKNYIQIICRCVLGFFAWSACVRFHSAIYSGHNFHKRVADLTLLLLATQFHLPFYMSRPLPNTFALIATIHANASWLKVLFV